MSTRRTPGDELSTSPPLKKAKKGRRSAEKREEVKEEQNISLQSNFPTSASMLLGAHVSIANGIPAALNEGKKLGCKSLAFFTGSQRKWSPPPFKPSEALNFQQSLRTSSFRPRDILVHGSYLLNLAAPDTATRTKSLALIRTEVERVAQLGLERYVFHPGAIGNPLTSGSTRGEITEEEGLSNVASALEETFQATKESAPNVTILVECTAGQGHTLGRTLEQLQKIISQVKSQERLGVCLDTCHLWAAGYDLSSAKSCEEFFQTFDSTIGFSRLKGFHLNDSKGSRHSRVDRHANIGEGTLGLEVFRFILNDLRFVDIPLVLETGGPYAPELQLLHSLISPSHH